MMRRLRILSSLTLPLAAAMVLQMPLPAQGGPVPTKTWTPQAGSKDWHDANNWQPNGVPTNTDKAVVPADSGEIEARNIDVHELDIQDSADGNPANDTKLTGNPDLSIRFGDGGMHVGAGCTVGGEDGAAGQSPQAGPPPVPGTDGVRGGNLFVRGSGRLTNRGTIRGGDGGDGPDLQNARNGGGVRLFTDGLDNEGGTIRGGDGGDKTGRDNVCGPPIPRGTGGNGADVHVGVNNPSPNDRPGTIRPGSGGTWTAGGPNETGRPGRDGRCFLHNLRLAKATSHVEGRDILVRCTGPLDLTEAVAGAFTASTVRVDAPAIDLTGVLPGTTVFQAQNVCLGAPLLLDPGTSIADYCGGGAVHLGPSAAAEWALPLLPAEPFDGLVLQPPVHWNAQLLQGQGGFRFDNPTGVPTAPQMGCGAAIVDAQLNPAGPLVAILQTPPVPGGDFGGPIVLEWTQWHQPSPTSQIGVIVVADGVPTPVLQTNQGSPPFDVVQLDITALVIGADEFFVNFVYNAQSQGVWVLDDIGVRVLDPVGPLGQPSQPGVALLGVDDARNADNLPVFFGEPGPYFVDVGVGDTMDLFVQTAPSQFVFLLAGTAMPNQFQLPSIGQLDLSLPLTVGTYFTDPLGGMNLPFLVPPAMQGLDLALQAAVTNPVQGIVATNAVVVQFGD
ncbi:MAG: hypothetical protein AB7O97_05620 [Planctomycetota bacterium]